MRTSDHVRPQNVTILNDNMDINALLEFSRQQDELIAGHQQQMQQVLDNNRHLRTALERSQATIAAQQAEIATQQAEIDALRRKVKQLKAERRQLLARPTNIEAGTYIEKQAIRKQVLAVPQQETNKIKRLTPLNTL